MVFFVTRLIIKFTILIVKRNISRDVYDPTEQLNVENLEPTLRLIGQTNVTFNNNFR